jgi:TRAP-type mannitol/chloroaromatic compound transport system permease small subunit
LSPAAGLVDRAIAAVSLWMGRVGGLLLLLAAIIVSFEVVVRKVLLLPFDVGTELSTYALAVGASWSFAYALLHRAHVRLDVIRRLLPETGRAVLDLLALVSLAGLGLLLAWHAWGTLATSWSLGARENTPLATPLVIPQALWTWGLAWFTIVAIQQTIVALFLLAHGDVAGVLGVAGPVGAEEEFAELLADVATAPQRIG